MLFFPGDGAVPRGDSRQTTGSVSLCTTRRMFGVVSGEAEEPCQWPRIRCADAINCTPSISHRGFRCLKRTSRPSACQKSVVACTAGALAYRRVRNRNETLPRNLRKSPPSPPNPVSCATSCAKQRPSSCRSIAACPALLRTPSPRRVTPPRSTSASGARVKKLSKH